MNLFSKTLVAALLALGACGTARADIVIDDFSLPNPGVAYSIIIDNTNPFTLNTNAVQPGINRSITLTVTSPAQVQDFSMTGTVGGGAATGHFSMSLDSVSSGNSKISYAFTSTMNFIPNVPGGGAVGALQYLSQADAGFGANVPLNFVIHTTTGDLTLNTFMNQTATLTPTDVPLASFTGTGDLTQVTGMDIMIFGSQAADVSLDAINITTPQGENPVPAPPAALLALLAIPALRLRHRWTKKEPALA